MKLIYVMILFLGWQSQVQGQMAQKIFEELKRDHKYTSYLLDCDVKKLSVSDIESLASELVNENIYKNQSTSFFIGNTNYKLNPVFKPLTYESKDGSISILIYQINDNSKVDSVWQEIETAKGTYSGLESHHQCYSYIKSEPNTNNSINATFQTKYHICHIRKTLSFQVEDFDNWNAPHFAEFKKENEKFSKIVDIVRDHLMTFNDKQNEPIIDRDLTADERLFGFMNFWSEVKYNFAFFDKNPELNWDKVLIDYMPKVRAEQSTFSYYKLMEEICAKLNDGHTNIYFPNGVNEELSQPSIQVRSFNGIVYIVNSSKKYEADIPLGSQILRINNVEVNQYMENKLMPYISASTSYIKNNIAVSQLLTGPADTDFTITIERPDNTQKTIQLKYTPDNMEWRWMSKNMSSRRYKIIDKNISYLNLNSFKDGEIVDFFTQKIDSIHLSKKLIIDLRSNGGGNSEYAYEILKYFAKKPFLTSKWATRQHRAAFKAWGKYTEDDDNDPLNKEIRLTYEGKYWYNAPPDTIVPYYDKTINISCVILIGNNTASAAEDFLIAEDNIGLAQTVGDYTYGSTGQPLWMKLPGGGSARICTKKDTYPDGREFVGYGIKPDHIVVGNINDYLADKDVVLEYAIQLLNKK